MKASKPELRRGGPGQQTGSNMSGDPIDGVSFREQLYVRA